MGNIVLYIATSLDGFIARLNGSIDWLFQGSEEQDYGYQDFIDSVDIILFGRKTFEQVLSFGKYPYQNKKAIIFTHQKDYASKIKQFTKEIPSNLKFISENITETIISLSKESNKDVWLVGGSNLIAQCFEAQIIDKLILFIHPIILGKGISLYPTLEKDCVLKLIKVEPYSNGLLEVQYEIEY